jgi:hypothetical protein
MGGEGQAQGGGSGGPPRAEVDSAPLNTQTTRSMTTDAAAVEAVPEAYREAVKRYFSAEESKPQEAPKQP